MLEENWCSYKDLEPIRRLRNEGRELSIEAKEHDFATPRNMYQLWVNTPIEEIKPLIQNTAKVSEAKQ